MRKFILIAGLVLASAAAQAGDSRSLSLIGGDTMAAPAPSKTADTTQTAQAPQAPQAPQAAQSPQATEAPRAEASKEAPKYIERPALVDPNDDLTGLENTRPPGTKVASTRTEKPRRKQRYWTEDRIISELHRYGIYW